MTKKTFRLSDSVAERMEVIRKRRGQSQTLYITNLILKDK